MSLGRDVADRAVQELGDAGDDVLTARLVQQRAVDAAERRDQRYKANQLKKAKRSAGVDVRDETVSVRTWYGSV